ncbi:LamG domain-containing protein [Catenulispora sp. MAP5-51]|uniref:LamG domain-containing protein n=1 Tax=unclassified Catenulispora TaxID=414885 RepID=UPI00351274BE
MTSFPLAATGTYAAVRPPEPPPVQAPPQGPPPMTSFPLAATGAFRAVGPQGNPDLSASGFRAVPGSEPGPQFNGPMGPPGQFGPPGPPAPPAGGGTAKRRKVLVIGASAVVVAGVAAGAVVFATSGSGKKQPDPAPTPSASHAALSGTSTSPGGTSQPPSSSAPATSKAAPPAAAPVADVLDWHLNDKAGSKTAADASGKNHAGALSGAAGFSTAHGGSVEFSGAANQIKAGQVQTKGPAIDTTKSFTVSMWVDQTGITTPTKFAAAFSQDGPQCFAFTFSYSVESKTWSFVRANADGAAPVAVSAGATAPTPMNTWVELTGVYDAQAGTIELFVNGAPQGGPLKTGSAPYAATGPFAIGRSWYKKYPSNPFKGYISDVRVFGRALTADEVKALG